jgi:hypothetical protein
MIMGKEENFNRGDSESTNVPEPQNSSEPAFPAYPVEVNDPGTGDANDHSTDLIEL